MCLDTMTAGQQGTAISGLQLFGLGMTAMSAYNQSANTKEVYKYQARVAQNNAILAEWEARDAIARGHVAEARTRMNTAQLKGNQEAVMAARGVALDEGSPLNILLDTKFMGEQDALTVRDNAARESWAARNQVGEYRSNSGFLRARANAESPGFMAGATLLTGAGTVADSWYRRKQAGVNG